MLARTPSRFRSFVNGHQLGRSESEQPNQLLTSPVKEGEEDRTRTKVRYPFSKSTFTSRHVNILLLGSAIWPVDMHT